MPLGTEEGIGPGHTVLDRNQASRKGAQLSISAHECGGETAGWIKMPLGMKVGLGPAHTVLDRNPTPLQKGGTSPSHFWPMSIVDKLLDGSRCHLARR